MAFENIIIGIGLLILGISSIYRVTIKNKAKEKELVFYHQLHLFKVLFGEKNAHKAMTIFVALWVIFFGFALLFNLISL